ncbi:MAG: FAD-dependent oxidoreductase [Rhodospirillum sp.]|nr:FAD-dependent oxidoreductase [Rhodospirillum sp.]MCF8503241.1 FAD-dependent oxidoreductase [Rhodospirillum sp.]
MSPLPKTTDILVVGGGILGCATALSLGRMGGGRGLPLERGRLGGAATARAVAALTRTRRKVHHMAFVDATLADIAAFREDPDSPPLVHQVGSLDIAGSSATAAPWPAPGYALRGSRRCPRLSAARVGGGW